MAAKLTLDPMEVERRVLVALETCEHTWTVKQAPQTARMISRFWTCCNLQAAGEPVGIQQACTAQRLRTVLRMMEGSEVAEGLQAIRGFGRVPRTWRSGGGGESGAGEEGSADTSGVICAVQSPRVELPTPSVDALESDMSNTADLIGEVESQEKPGTTIYNFEVCFADIGPHEVEATRSFMGDFVNRQQLHPWPVHQRKQVEAFVKTAMVKILGT